MLRPILSLRRHPPLNSQGRGTLGMPPFSAVLVSDFAQDKVPQNEFSSFCGTFYSLNNPVFVQLTAIKNSGKNRHGSAPSKSAVYFYFGRRNRRHCFWEIPILPVFLFFVFQRIGPFHPSFPARRQRQRRRLQRQALRQQQRITAPPLKGFMPFYAAADRFAIFCGIIAPRFSLSRFRGYRSGRRSV